MIVLIILVVLMACFILSKGLDGYLREYLGGSYVYGFYVATVKLDNIDNSIVTSSTYSNAMYTFAYAHGLMIGKKESLELKPNAFNDLPRTVYVNHVNYNFDVFNHDTIDIKKYIPSYYGKLVKYEDVCKRLNNAKLVRGCQYDAQFVSMSGQLFGDMVRKSPGFNTITRGLIVDNYCKGTKFFSDPLNNIDELADKSSNKLIVTGFNPFDFERLWVKTFEGLGYKEINIIDFATQYLLYESAEQFISSNPLYKESRGGYNVLFHGSPKKLKMIKPNPHPNFPKPVVFATTDYATAVLFSGKWDTYRFTILARNIIEGYPGAFDKLKADSYIHHLSDENFIYDHRAPMYIGGENLVSFKKVKAFRVDKVKPLNYLSESGCPLVYFNDFAKSLIDPLFYFEEKCKYWILCVHPGSKWHVIKKLSEKHDIVHDESKVQYKVSEDSIIVGGLIEHENVRYVGKKYFIAENLDNEKQNYYLKNADDEDEYVEAWSGLYTKLGFEKISFDELANI